MKTVNTITNLFTTLKFIYLVYTENSEHLTAGNDDNFYAEELPDDGIEYDGCYEMNGEYIIRCEQ